MNTYRQKEFSYTKVTTSLAYTDQCEMYNPISMFTEISQGCSYLIYCLVQQMFFSNYDKVVCLKVLKLNQNKTCEIFKNI